VPIKGDERTSEGGAVAPESNVSKRDVSKINTRTAPTWYIALMAAWVYGFAGSDRDLPPLLVFFLLVVAGAIHVGAGYLIGRWEALVLAVVPVLLALAASGSDSSLWITLVLLMVFPGAPLIGLGVWLRDWTAERDDRSPDGWLYGDSPR
jgi:hypothetical protein